MVAEVAAEVDPTTKLWNYFQTFCSVCSAGNVVVDVQELVNPLLDTFKRNLSEFKLCLRYD